MVVFCDEHGMETAPELYHLPGFYEPFSAISHLFGAVVFSALGLLLLRRAGGDRERLIFLGVYVASCVFALSMSTLFHMLVRGGRGHRVVELLDHGAIFLFIAGSFTPAHGLLFRGWLRWGPLVLIWGAALTGIAVKTLFFDDLEEWLGLTLYLALGWFGAISGLLLALRHGFLFVQPLLGGGVAYSVGAIVQFNQGLILIPGVVHPHELFHLAVLIGAFYHWLFVWQFANGEPTMHQWPAVRMKRHHPLGEAGGGGECSLICWGKRVLA